MMETVRQVAECGLCVGCGTCAGICPQDAITMEALKVEHHYLPKVIDKKCTRCGLCVESCPGYQVDFIDLNSKFFGEQPSDAIFGHNRGCYVGYSNDSNLRYNCTSGGISSQILIYALDSGLIDGALMIKMKEGYPLKSEAIIVTSKEEVVNNSGSKYFPAAVNEGLKYIIKEGGRFAVVGLPCHIHGVRKAEVAFEKLRKSIVLHIGLMCSHTVNFAGSEFLLDKINVTKESVTKIDYRGNGWPGLMSVKLNNSETKHLKYVGGWNSYWPVFSSFFFTPMRCVMCPDELNELADISLGDAWISELMKKDDFGYSIVVVRSESGQTILDQVKYSGKISLEHVDPEKVKKSQAIPIKFKKSDFKNRMAMLEALGKNVPNFRFNSLGGTRSSSFWTKARNLFSLINVYLSSKKFVRSCLVNVPLPVFRLYYGIFKVLSLI